MKKDIQKLMKALQDVQSYFISHTGQLADITITLNALELECLGQQLTEISVVSTRPTTNRYFTGIIAGCKFVENQNE